MNRFIEYSSEELKRSLERNLDDLNVFRYNNEYRNILGQPFIDKLSQWENNIARCKASPFTIAVIGDFKRGKSTLINALLGEEIVATDVTTETVTLNRIYYGISGNEAILSGNRSIRLDNSELRREKIECLMNELCEPIQRIEIRRPCELLEKVTIIDTPGTGDGMQDFSDVVKESLLQADAVIYVYNVQYPLSRSEQMFLKAVVLPQKHTSLFMVGNYGDTLGTKAAYSKMADMLMGRVHNLLPNADPYVVSALDELCLKSGESTTETELTSVLRARFCDLRNEINELIDSRQNTVIVDRMQRMSMSMIHELELLLDAMEEGLGLSIKEAESVLSEAENARTDSIKMKSELIDEVHQVIQNMKSETNAWMGEFIGRIVEEAKHLGSASNDDLKRYYEFYCIDLLQEAMNTCIEYHEERLFDVMDSAAEGISRMAANELIGKRTYYFRMNLDNQIWTKGDTVGLAASRAAEMNWLTRAASIIADGISGVMREKEKQTRVPELIGQISRKLLQMSVMVSDTVDQVYHELGEKSKQLLSDYYGEEMAHTQQLFEQTAQAAAKSAEEKARMKDTIKQAREILSRFYETL